MCERLASSNNPSLILMNYDVARFGVTDLFFVPKHFFALYPGNRNVRPKIRQQLQILRDRGFLEFTGRGKYRMRGLE